MKEPHVEGSSDPPRPRVMAVCPREHSVGVDRGRRRLGIELGPNKGQQRGQATFSLAFAGGRAVGRWTASPKRRPPGGPRPPSRTAGHDPHTAEWPPTLARSVRG